VTTDYQWVVDSTGTAVTNGGKSLLDKTDPRPLAREQYVLGHVMAHLAAYDTTHTLVGIQILNEPNVSNVWGKQVGRSYSTYSTQLWNDGGYTSEAQFRNDVMLHYLSELGRTVKESQHSVWTRCNVIGDAKPVAENEARRQQGTAYLDFFGGDPYTQDQDTIYNYGLTSTASPATRCSTCTPPSTRTPHRGGAAWVWTRSVSFSGQVSASPPTSTRAVRPARSSARTWLATVRSS
jgi:hypothetical protein